MLLLRGTIAARRVMIYLFLLTTAAAGWVLGDALFDGPVLLGPIALASVGWVLAFAAWRWRRRRLAHDAPDLLLVDR